MVGTDTIDPALEGRPPPPAGGSYSSGCVGEAHRIVVVVVVGSTWLGVALKWPMAALTDGPVVVVIVVRMDEIGPACAKCLTLPSPWS